MVERPAVNIVEIRQLSEAIRIEKRGELLETPKGVISSQVRPGRKGSETILKRSTPMNIGGSASPPDNHWG